MGNANTGTNNGNGTGSGAANGAAGQGAQGAAAGQGNGAGNGAQGEGALSWDTWFQGQPEQVQKLIAEREAPLKNTIATVRRERDTFEGQLKTMAKGLEDGNAMKTQIEQLMSQIAELNAKDGFTAAALKAGVAPESVELAYLGAKNAGLIPAKGEVNFADIQSRFPMLFTPKKTPPPANGGAGSGGAGNGAGFNMNDAIRRAAGRRG
jgi:hypothetical protein